MRKTPGMAQSAVMLILGLVVVPASAADADGFAAAAPREIHSWTGLYVGFGAGGIMDDRQIRYTDAAATRFSIDMNHSNWLAGAQAGYNIELGEIMFAGFEADFYGTGAKKSRTPCFADITVPCTARIKLPWIATARARLGLNTGALLAYVTGGGALTSLNYRITLPTGVASHRDATVGWTLGVGAEYRLARHWSIRSEYLYTKFALKAFHNFPDIGERMGFKAKQHQVRLGLNYHF